MVVDGGATKTAVALTNALDGKYFKGYSGPANIFSLSKAQVLNSITVATENALESRAKEGWNNHQLIPVPTKVSDLRVKSLIVGLAGGLSVNKDKLQELEALLQKMFSQVDSIKVMSDLFLLPLAVPARKETQYSIALLAGTGSSSLCFSTTSPGEPVFLGRSGGWGAHFGEAGAGFSIGMKAIKITLREIDRYNIMNNLGKEMALKSFHQEIFHAIVGTDHTKENSNMFVTLDKLFNDSTNLGETRRKIASLSKVVFDQLSASDGSEVIADEILLAESKALIRVITPFTDHIDTRKSSLILSGSLFSVCYYYDLFCNQLHSAGIDFDDIIVIEDPSVAVLEQLTSK